MADNDNNENSQPGPDLSKGFKLGDFEIYPNQNAIVRGDERNRIEHKVMDVLVCMARRGGDTVTRAEFEEEVWPGRIVEQGNLDRAISMVRSALGDRASEPSYVQTIPTIGYRLIADVAPLISDQASMPAPARWRNPMLIGIGVIVLIGLALIVTRQDVLETGLPLNTITVQCFDNLSDDPDSEYFVEGLADEIRVALGRVEGIRVVTRTSSEAYCDRGLPMTEIGRELGAGSVLEGRVRRAGDLVKIVVQLGRTSNGHTLLSETYDGTLADIFEVQDRIARDVARKLRVALSPGAKLVVAPTEDLDAYQLYLRAHFQLRRRGAEPMRRAVELFQLAIARDPGFGRAYQGLAEAFVLMPSYTGASAPAFVEMAVAALEQAEQLGGTDSHAEAIRGFISFNQLDWPAAHAAFALALEGEPDHSDLLQWHSQFLAGIGYVDQSAAQAERAVKEDPLSPVAHQRLGVMRMWNGDLEGAEEQFRIATEELGLEPLANARTLVPLMFRRGQFEAGEAHTLAMLTATGEASDWIEPWVAFIRGEGESKPAVERLEAAYQAQRLDSRIYVGALYFLDDVDALYQAIDQVRARGQQLDHEVWFVDEGRFMQNDPRFPGLLERWGILDFWDRHGWPSGCLRDAELIRCAWQTDPDRQFTPGATPGVRPEGSPGS